jgi:two-component system, chemotaxis family, CheB/CheR fusion protein
MAEYADFLSHNPQEVDLLFNEFLIGVTSFFRDGEVWDHLIEVALPELLARPTTGPELRAWCIGCSTGEEAYSLAIAISEVMAGQSRPFKLKIFASDLNPDAIASARRGEYPLSIETNVSRARLERYFSKHDSHYRIKKSIRDLVLFAQHDVILDPPFTRLDLISCRNLLIYFDPQLQQRLLPLFNYSLRPGGLLLLGSAEGIGRLGHLFTPLHARLRLFRRQEPAFGRRADFLLRSYPPISESPGSAM